MRNKHFYIFFILFLIFSISLVSFAGDLIIKDTRGKEIKISPIKGFFGDEKGNISILIDDLDSYIQQFQPIISISGFQDCNGDNSMGVINGTKNIPLHFTVIATDNEGTPNLKCLYPFEQDYRGNQGVFSYTYDKVGQYLAIFSATVQVGNETYSSQRVIKINISDKSNPADNIPPQIQITSPITNGGTYTTSSQTITIQGTASDNVGVDRVMWNINGGSDNQASGTTDWSFSVNLQNGNNLITVKAYDAAGNSTSATITVIYNPTSGGYTDKVNNAIKINGPFEKFGYWYVFDVEIKRGTTKYFLIDPKNFGIQYSDILTTISIRIEDMSFGERAIFEFKILELDGNNELVRTWPVSPGTGGMYTCYVKNYTEEKYKNNYKILIEAIEKGYGDTTMNVKWN